METSLVLLNAYTSLGQNSGSCSYTSQVFTYSGICIIDVWSEFQKHKFIQTVIVESLNNYKRNSLVDIFFPEQATRFIFKSRKRNWFLFNLGNIFIQISYKCLEHFQNDVIN